MSNIALLPREEIVQADDVEFVPDQPFAQMAAKEPRSASNQDPDVQRTRKAFTHLAFSMDPVSEDFGHWE